MHSQFRRYVEARVQIRRLVALSQENTLRYDHKGKGKTVPEGIRDSEYIASLMYIIFTNWVVSVHLCTPAASIPGIVRLKRGGTSLRENAGFKGKQANGVGTQLMKREITACTALLPCYYYDVFTSPASA
jgi:hypothetical protein